MHSSLLQTSLKVRLALLLGVLLATFLATWHWLRVAERAREGQLRDESLATSEQLVLRWIDLTNQPLRRFTQDFSQWEALADFVRRPDAAWAEANVRPNLATYEAHAVWILAADGRLLYSAQANPGPALPPPVAVPETTAGEGSLFVESRDGLLEIWRRPIRAESAGTAPAGWLLVARLWGPRHLATLGRLSETDLLIIPADTATAGAPEREIRRPLPGPAGPPQHQLVIRPLSGPATGTDDDMLTAYLFVTFGILLVLALWLAVRQWVFRPLDRIGESLRRDDPTAIQPLLQDRTELGRVAQLIESAFRQKTALAQEIEERRRTEQALRESETRLRQALDLRARLARDLHDGVIQSIYAAGLGLEGAMTQLEKDAEGARVRLQLCRQSLNEVIREVRGFISGIEPEALHHQGFEQELASLVRTMQALWPVLISVQADPATVGRLTPTQELHALQICRECISNAVRHGAAREIGIHFGAESGTALLRVRDAGRGFDPTAVGGRGHGLANLAVRARELGGQLRIESRPGAGATFTVTFPLDSARP